MVRNSKNSHGILVTFLGLLIIGLGIWLTNNILPLLGILIFTKYLPKHKWEKNSPITTNMIGGTAMSGSIILAWYGIWLTSNLDSLLVLVLVVWITEGFQWNKNHDLSITLSGTIAVFLGTFVIIWSAIYTKSNIAYWGFAPLFWLITDHPWPTIRKLRERYLTKTYKAFNRYRFKKV